MSILKFPVKVAQHYLILAAILLLGILLRFWNLDSKPLWMDEMITAVLSFGRSYYDVPVEQILPLSAFERVFTLNSAATCAQIAQTVSAQSVHPPLFFCWMHNWLSWINWLPVSWVWKLRSLPALFGVVAIAALYLLNRVAFSPRAGLLGAAVMAVSPFAIYLSQEARHYTLPMLLVSLALLGLYHVLTDLEHQQFRPAIWLGWIAINSLGFYVHYFFLLVLVGQVGALIVGVRRQASGVRESTGWGDGLRRERSAEQRSAEREMGFDVSAQPNGRWGDGEKKKIPNLQSSIFNLQSPHPLISITLSLTVICLTYLPWLSTFWGHINRPETDWMKPFTPTWVDKLAPLYQLPMGWMLMLITLPVEDQPLWIAIPAGILMLGLTAWLIWQMSRRIQQLWRIPETHLATQMLVVFITVIVLEFLAIAYILGKDITLVPRYNFIYFPAICALLGACLCTQPKPNQTPAKTRKQRLHPSPLTPHPSPLLSNKTLIYSVLFVGILSSTFVISNLAFQKPYNPDKVTQDMRLDTPTTPVTVATVYGDFQDIALGLSFAFRLDKQKSTQSTPQPSTHFTFLARLQPYEKVWETFATLAQPSSFPLNLWVVSPGLKRVGYPEQLLLKDTTGSQHRCQVDPAHYHRLGIPYQLYRCR